MNNPQLGVREVGYVNHLIVPKTLRNINAAGSIHRHLLQLVSKTRQMVDSFLGIDINVEACQTWQVRVTGISRVWNTLRHWSVPAVGSC